MTYTSQTRKRKSNDKLRIQVSGGREKAKINCKKKKQNSTKKRIEQ